MNRGTVERKREWFRPMDRGKSEARRGREWAKMVREFTPWPAATHRKASLVLCLGSTAEMTLLMKA